MSPNRPTAPAAAAPIALTRTVRFALLPAGAAADPAPAARNGFAGVPCAHGLRAHHELTLRLAGVPDARTGYLVGIQEIDALVRAHLVPRLQAMFVASPTPSEREALVQLGRAAQEHAPAGTRLIHLTWSPSPFVQHLWSPAMPASATLVEHFEFSASHRLHCPQLSDEENRRVFGKCNHPNGHGHNYRLAVAVRVPVDAPAPTLGVGALAAIVDAQVLARMDHKHLNTDCPEFAQRNPSVENIAAVCHGLLEPPVRAAGAELAWVRVWETEKTSAVYPAGGEG
ncbi:MAG: 6-carboxytetrahydropterin synthase [Phycisphaerales bacterium]